MRTKRSGKQNTAGWKLSGSRGMTMGEMLVVVAIIGILAGVAFVSVASHQKSLAQLERDNIAKEIFVAAQNHLTMAKGEAYLGVNKFGYDGKISGNSDKDVYYYAVNGGVTTPGAGDDNDANDIFAQTLPFGAIDETVRGGGSYIIRYQKESGLVLDVFYCSAAGSRFGYDLASDVKGDYASLMSDEYYGPDKRDARNGYKDGKAIVGWYGGAAAADLEEVTMNPPALNVVNAETLYVEITDTVKGEQLIPGTSETLSGKYGIRLFITGKSSKKQHYIDILVKGNVTNPDDVTYDPATKKYTYVLDDITKDTGDHFANRHFYSLEPDDTNGFATTPNAVSGTGANDFIPGEDITLQAVTYTNDYLSNVARSEVKVTNSLFAGIEDKTGNDTPDVAYVSNIRHLENLDYAVSKLERDDSPTRTNEEGKLCIGQAIQTADLLWEGGDKGFLNKVRKQRGLDANAEISISYGAGPSLSADGTEANCFKPVDFTGKNLYDGKGHSIKNVKVRGKRTEDSDGNTLSSGNAGLFSATSFGTTLKNLELIDFDVQSDGGNAGALAGSLTDTGVINVIARNSKEKVTTIEGRGEGASAGGLVGTMTGGRARYSAASMVVKGADAAGGLIGQTEDYTSGGNTVYPKISQCYSAGHTKNGSYQEWVTEKVDGTEHGYDVTGSVAGGLIGKAGNAEIKDSYSTCSVSGSTNAGGFVGTAAVRSVDGGKSISDCYCTGLVETTVLDSENTARDNNPNAGRGAFAGSLGDNDSVKPASCACFSIINEITKKEKNTDDGSLERYLYAVGDDESKDWDIQAIDGNAASYEAFVGGKDVWNPAVAYDEKLKDYYNNEEKGKYPFRTVDQLPAGETKASKAVTTDDYNSEYIRFAHTHYGDWPAPEVFIINH